MGPARLRPRTTLRQTVVGASVRICTHLERIPRSEVERNLPIHNSIVCAHCGKPFQKTRAWAKFCCSSCRRSACENRKRDLPDVALENAAETASKAVAVLDRLKGYIVTAEQIPRTCELARKMLEMANPSRPRLQETPPEGSRRINHASVTDPMVILKVLLDFEKELISMGGLYSQDLAATVFTVEHAFIGSRLVAIC